MRCPTHRTRTRIIVTLLLTASTEIAAQQPAQQPPAAATPGAVARLVAVRAPTPPAMDGRLDDAVWQLSTPVTSFTQARPEPGSPASQLTEVRVLYDDHAIYVGARMFDALPDSIAAPLARRDATVYSDWFGVGLDTYRDGRSAFHFAVNPRGVKRDTRLFNDSNRDPGWDAVWEAATRVDDTGWTAEIRIPLSQLRFAAAAPGEPMVWGVNLTRELARREEVAHWSPTPPDASGVVSRYGELHGLAGLSAPRRLELQPYSVARVTRAPGDPQSPFHRDTDLFGSAGLDLKWGVTQQLTLTATLNPDFGQVEADPAVVNLTAFESFFEEKRPFFTEGAEIFAAGWPQLFYSRRIGRAPRGPAPAGALHVDRPAATTILGAAKLTGRLAGGWSVGLLTAMTGEEQVRYALADERLGSVAAEPATGYTVARVTRDLRGGRTVVGGIVTATQRRLPEGAMRDLMPAAAYTGGLDLRHRIGENHLVQAALLGSRVSGSDSAMARIQRAPGHYFHRPDADHLRYDPTRESLAGSGGRLTVQRTGGGPWRWWSSMTGFSPAFEINDLGYGFVADMLRQTSGVGYEQHRPGPVLQQWSFTVGQNSSWTAGGERQDAALDLYGEAQLRNRWGGSVWYMRHVGGLATTTLQGGPALHYPGRHMGSFGLYSDRRRPLRFAASTYWEVEDGTGSHELQAGTTVWVRAANRLNLSVRPSLSRSVNDWQYFGRRTVDGEPLYLLARLDRRTASITGRLDYTFSPILSLQLYGQPFVSAGEYNRFRTVADARAPEFERRFHTFTPGEISSTPLAGGGRRWQVEPAGSPSGGFNFTDPSFNQRHFRSNAVLRWEYRPGSSLFLVWSQSRSGFDPEGRLRPARDADLLLRDPGTNVLLLKLSYWVGL
jgi:hypothetical protein